MIYSLVKKGEGDKILAVFSFDSLNSFDESWSAAVTTQTVESGFNITDNVNIEPPSFDLEGVVSEYSIFDDSREIVWSNNNFNVKTLPNVNRHIAAREYITDLFKSSSVLTIVESSVNSRLPDLKGRYDELSSGYIKEIDNCVMTSLSISYPSNSSSAFLVNIKLQKIDIAVIEVTALLDGQVSALLQPLAPKETSEGTRASTSKKTVTDGDGNIVSTEANFETKPEVTQPTEGISFEQGLAIERIKDKVVQDKIDSNKAQWTYMKYSERNDKSQVLRNGVWVLE